MNGRAIWDDLTEWIGNPYGAAGVMGNLYAESGLNPQNLQNSYEKKLGMTDERYTEAVDSGRYTNFTHDGAGYGLAQWTYWSRKKALLLYAKEQGKSVGALDAQLGYLRKEMQGYASLMTTLKNAKSVREASDAVLTQYEKPKDMSESAKERRAGYGQRFYDEFAGTQSATPAASAPAAAETAPRRAVNGFDRQKVIDLALGEVGYLEKASREALDDKTANAGDKNFTKYARDLDAIPGFYNGKKQGVAWCDVFVDWCFVQAYGVYDGMALLCQPTKSAGAGCRYSRNYYKAKGRLYDTPEPGDQVFFWPANEIGGPKVQHTGLVVAVDAQYIHTVEGNTTVSGAHNGGGVARKKYARDYARLAGFGRPNWGAGSSIQPTPVQPEPDPAPTTSGKTVVVTASSVNVRTGNGLQFSRITAVIKGTILEWVATAENGWHAVVYKKQVAWVSGEYCEVRG